MADDGDDVMASGESSGAGHAEKVATMTSPQAVRAAASHFLKKLSRRQPLSNDDDMTTEHSHSGSEA